MRYHGHDIALVIFDLDGTLLDSTGIWGEIDKIFFSRHGMEVPEGYGKEIAVLGLRRGATYTREHYVPTLNEEEILREWNDLSVEEYEKHLPLKPGAKEILDYCRSLGLKLAVATSNSPELYRPCIQRLGIAGYFDCFVDETDVHNGKKTSAMYDLICKKLGYSPAETLVLEDTLDPIRNASAAGYATMAVFDPHTSKGKALHMEASEYFAEDLADALRHLREENAR